MSGSTAGAGGLTGRTQQLIDATCVDKRESPDLRATSSLVYMMC